MKVFFLKVGVVAIFLLFVVTLIVPNLSSAADSGIQISPLTYNLEVSPGESEDISIKVTNLNDEDLSYVIEIENFNNVSDEGAPSFSNQDTDADITSLKDWIVVNPTSDKEGIIKPRESKDISFSINIPKGAEAGGHYAAVFAKEVKKTDEGKTQIGVSSRVGTLVLVSIPGNVVKSAEISEFNPKKIVWAGPVDLSMKVRNTGTVHYDSQGTVEIKSLIGNTSEVDMGTHTIIPKNERLYTGGWSQKYPFGRYILAAKAVDGNGDIVSTSRIVWAIPLIIVIPVLVGLIILIWVIMYFKRHVRIIK